MKKNYTKFWQNLANRKTSLSKSAWNCFTTPAIGVVKELTDQGYKIFLDLKMHDIPNTVYNGAKALAKLGITFTTVHALGGSQIDQGR